MSVGDDVPDHCLVNASGQKGISQGSGRRFNLTITQTGWEDAAPHSQLVVIGATGRVDGDAVNRRMEICLAVSAPTSERAYGTGAVIAWLRRRLPGLS